MSTRLRPVFRYPNGDTLRGSMAIVHLISVVKKLVRPTILARMSGSKQQKLETLARQLPEGCALILIREPKHTRKNRSLYWAPMAPVEKPGLVVAEQQVVLGNGNVMNWGGANQFYALAPAPEQPQQPPRRQR